jgi:hypothetical protein
MENLYFLFLLFIFFINYFSSLNFSFLQFIIRYHQIGAELGGREGAHTLPLTSKNIFYPW